MPDKRARRHFSQLSEFERGLIIGMKTAGWLTHRVGGQMDRSECAIRNCWEQWTREGTQARKTEFGATRKTTKNVGVAIVQQTISRHIEEANLKYKHPFRALPLTPEHRQLRLQWCQARLMWNVPDWERLCLVMNPGLFSGQMITVYGCGVALESARCKKPHTIAEELILSAAIKIVETMFGDKFAKELQSIHLSNDAVSCRIDDTAEDVEQQLFVKLRDNFFFNSAL
ncbi:uncharacterized protein TNCV_2473511 [Trichonephila clavipes]|nr:uncharacterized protein TNCV_2473511 [Trichonephila clavipes]